jgi:hypothetical protein
LVTRKQFWDHRYWSTDVRIGGLGFESTDRDSFLACHLISNVIEDIALFRCLALFPFMVALIGIASAATWCASLALIQSKKGIDNIAPAMDRQKIAFAILRHQFE